MTRLTLCRRCLNIMVAQIVSDGPRLGVCEPCRAQNQPRPVDPAEIERLWREGDENKEALMRPDPVCSQVPFKARKGVPFREGLVRDGRVIGYRELVDGAWVYHLDKGEEPYAETLR